RDCKPDELLKQTPSTEPRVPQLPRRQRYAAAERQCREPARFAQPRPRETRNRVLRVQQRTAVELDRSRVTVRRTGQPLQAGEHRNWEREFCWCAGNGGRHSAPPRLSKRYDSAAGADQLRRLGRNSCGGNELQRSERVELGTGLLRRYQRRELQHSVPEP